MSDKVITCGTSLYGKRNREIKSGVIFGTVSLILLCILAVFVVVNNFVFVKVMVSGSSMYPTLKDKDLVSVNVYRAPTYGDIIVISGEKQNGDWLIKRAIAFGGDTVKIENGNVYLKKAGETEFAKLSEPYLTMQGITFYPNVDQIGDTETQLWEIEADCVFYLGDNRTRSKDSRSEFGTCEKSQVVGVVSEFALRTRGINKFFDNIASAVKNFFSF